MTLTYQDPSCEIHQGHILDVLAGMLAESVDCCITSPPYWGLRKYSGEQNLIWGGKEDCPHEWGKRIVKDKRGLQMGKEVSADTRGCGNGQFCSLCGAWRGALGLEPTPELYIAHLLEIFRAVRRVLKPFGVVWINCGDSYAANWRGSDASNASAMQLGNAGTLPFMGQRNHHYPYKPLDLCGIPESLVLALRADGWYWRSTIIWAKTNPMPESIRGWYFTRHRVTIEEYEKLSSLWTTKGRDKDRASNLSRMSAGQISDCEEAISTIGKGQKDSQAARGTGGCPGEEEIILSIRKRTGQSSEIQRHPEGQDNSPSYNSALSSKEDTGRPRDDDQRLVRDSEAAQVPMFLLQEEGCSSDNGPRDTTGQGRIAYQGEYSSCLPQLQRSETGQNRDALIDCPGCPTCLPNDGLVLRKGSWRPTSSFEYVFMLAKSKDYFCDGEAVREPHKEPERGQGEIERYGKYQPNTDDPYITRWTPAVRLYNPAGRNLRDVWTINTQSFSGAHFATFPEDLVTKPILASTSEKGNCPKCGMPWVRVIQQEKKNVRPHHLYSGKSFDATHTDLGKEVKPSAGFSRTGEQFEWATETLSWRASCSCGITEAIPAIVLDPFCGSGTTGKVAKQLGRRVILIDISEEYCSLAKERIEAVSLPMRL